MKVVRFLSVSFALAIGSLSLVACGGSKGKGGAVAANGAKTEERRDLAKPAVQALVEGAAFAKIYLKEGDATGAKQKAIDKLKVALSLDGRLWEARYNLGLVYARAGELTEAESNLADAAAAAPEAEQVAVALCEVRRRRGETKLASEGLEAFCKAHTNALDARARLVVVLREAGRNDEAIGHARFLLARRPLDDATRAELALSHLAKGERDVAELLVAQALKQNPKSAPAWRAQGLIALQKGDDAEAFRAFETCASLDPTDSTARINMGAVLLRAGAFKEAEAAFRAALANIPNDVEAMLGIAVAMRSQKKLEEARVAYEKVLSLAPRHLAATFNLAVLYADYLKNTDKARTLFKQVASDAPANSPLRFEAERYLKEMGGDGPLKPAAAVVPPDAPPTPPPPTSGSASPKGPLPPPPKK